MMYSLRLENFVLRECFLWGRTGSEGFRDTPLSLPAGYDFTFGELYEHVRIMVDAGLIEADFRTDEVGNPSIYPGHVLRQGALRREENDRYNNLLSSIDGVKRKID